MGIDYDTPLLDRSAMTDFLLVKDADAITMLKTLAREFGLLVGPASGAVAQATYEYAKTAPKDAVIVMLFGDSGRAYLTKSFYEDVTSDAQKAPHLPTNSEKQILV